MAFNIGVEPMIPDSLEEITPEKLAQFQEALLTMRKADPDINRDEPPPHDRPR